MYDRVPQLLPKGLPMLIGLYMQDFGRLKEYNNHTNSTVSDEVIPYDSLLEKSNEQVPRLLVEAAP